MAIRLDSASISFPCDLDSKLRRFSSRVQHAHVIQSIRGKEDELRSKSYDGNVEVRSKSRYIDNEQSTRDLENEIMIAARS